MRYIRSRRCSRIKQFLLILPILSTYIFFRNTRGSEWIISKMKTCCYVVCYVPVSCLNGVLFVLEKCLGVPLSRIQACRRSLSQASLRWASDDPQTTSRKRLLSDDSVESGSVAVHVQNARNGCQRCAITTNTNVQLREEASDLQAKCAELTDRLSSEMNAKIAANESSFENTSIRARPLNIADDYNLLTSNAWLDAKTALDAIQESEEANTEMLLSILLVSEQTAMEMYRTAMMNINTILDHPFQQKEDEKSRIQLAGGPTLTGTIPQQCVTVLGDHLRVNADSVHIQALVQIIQNKLKSAEDKPANLDTTLDTQEVVHYTTECARLAWKMAIQRPPMCFDTSHRGRIWAKVPQEQYEPVWNSQPNNEGAKVVYYKCPVLKHGDRVMAKGFVYVA